MKQTTKWFIEDLFLFTIFVGPFAIIIGSALVTLFLYGILPLFT